MKLIDVSKLRIGIDFGETVESKNERGEKLENLRAMEVIARLVKAGAEVFIISKVNPQQMVDVATWMRDHDFFDKTGVKMENVRFCPGRRDKGPIALGLQLTHHIDDRPEVMAFMSDDVIKIMFRPIHADVKKWNVKKCWTVNSWTEIEGMFFQ